MREMPNFHRLEEGCRQMNPAIAEKIAAAKPPVRVDTEGACRIVEEIEGRRPAKETLRRWRIPYRLIGRTRIYEVDDVIEHARSRYQTAPVRLAAARP
jgi:hypothetical protein